MLPKRRGLGIAADEAARTQGEAAVRSGSMRAPYRGGEDEEAMPAGVPYDMKYDPRQDTANRRRVDLGRLRDDMQADAEEMVWGGNGSPGDDRAVEAWKSKWRKKFKEYGAATDEEMAEADALMDEILDDGSDRW